MPENEHNDPLPGKSSITAWIDARLPVFSLIRKEYGQFPMPKNLNWMWCLGGIAGVMVLIMIATGLTLALHYTANTENAFASVEAIMRDVDQGWMIRTLHMTGASFLFAAVYIHIFRGMYYGSYKNPRELVWGLGMVIFMIMTATAFTGYTLPWSQMSGWAATVVTDLFSAIPVIGDDLVLFIRGGYMVGDPTLKRFFVMHIILPFVMIGVIALHVWAVHKARPNNPLGIDPKGPQDTIPFHPYYTIRDLFALSVFLIPYIAVTFFAPHVLTHPEHFMPFDPLITPGHLVPEWYLVPFYAILRSVTFDIGIPGTGIVLIDAKLGGVLAMLGAFAVLFALPWLDTHPVKSARFRPYYRGALMLFVAAFILLGVSGTHTPEGLWLWVGQACTAYYFAFFLIVLPLLSRFEKTLPLPLPVSIHRPLILLTGLLILAFPVKPAHADLERGYQVFRQSCAACHSLEFVRFRDLEDAGFALETSEDQKPFPFPYPDKDTAMALNNGAIPPDLSLITKARHGGPEYIRDLLGGYYASPPDQDMLTQGQYWNTAMRGHVIAMVPPLADGIISYEDGAPETVSQYAKDVADFLTWAAAPYETPQKQAGLKGLLFLLVFSIILYQAKKTLR